MTGLLLRLARQWIAGERAEDGIERVREANDRGVLGLLNLLGEHVEERAQVEETREDYERLLGLIERSGVKSQISAKPTQMGLNLDFDYCVQNYLKLAESCKSRGGNWLWIDMENSPYTQKTIDLYCRVLDAYPSAGIAIQAYMKRSEKDLEFLLSRGAKIRLVKGAYNESPGLVFKGKRAVRENYSKLMEKLFSQRNFFAVATHDGDLIEYSKKLARGGGASFEYEMLMGVRDSLKVELVREGYQVREYVPYGPEWLPYSIRRIREKKSNVLLLLRSLFSS